MFSIFRTKQFLNYGLPFFIVVIGGSFYLREFTEIKFKYKEERLNQIDWRDFEKAGIDIKKKTINFEEELENIREAHDNHQWTNVRAPRPWEANEDFLLTVRNAEKKLEEQISQEKAAKKQNKDTF